MDSAMAEALAQAEGEQDMDKKIEQALSCPCLGASSRKGGRKVLLAGHSFACGLVGAGLICRWDLLLIRPPACLPACPPICPPA